MIQIIEATMSGVSDIRERLSAGAGVRRRLGAGEMLFAAGDPVRSLFVVESGRLRLLRHTVHGAALALHVAQAGEAFAEASLFSRSYHCDALAEIPSTVIAYPKRALLGALREDPEAAVTLVGTSRNRCKRCAAALSCSMSNPPAIGCSVIYTVGWRIGHGRRAGSDLEGDRQRDRPHPRGRLSSPRGA